MIRGKMRIRSNKSNKKEEEKEIATERKSKIEMLNCGKKTRKRGRKGRKG